ncbi:thiamine pyrophosphate-dependent enzyme [Polynucleobacter sp. 80A-SIGWE]|uniref:thiamine pyrophosphate-dependent enzyme n=1 Tax=Polynucleobacter sp. 80A-SIGWE TaxID=2689100 RepID=UPI001C0BF58D|nr:thiamine pyrophosphate-dependent enzyme [Polynucleobacter sp. 80A-SIGWE]MBU3589078.1 hypothetical protein [Polynucleobacter sp. 80A-SIGWE]
MIKQLEIRKKILEYAISSREGHIASSYSIVDILIAIIEYQKNIYGEVKLDNIVLSKGHAVFALYATMASYGLLDQGHERSIGLDGSRLIGHVPLLPEYGFHYGTGSLGQGLPYAIGLSYARSINKEIFVIVGDGEMNEGSCWESFLMLKKFNIPVRVIVDCNESSERALPVVGALKALAGEYQHRIIDGHKVEKIVEVFSALNNSAPAVILCNTKKGHPLQELSTPMWHHKTPSPDEFECILSSLIEFYK